MKLDQQDKYGKFSIFIAGEADSNAFVVECLILTCVQGAYFVRNFFCNPHFLVPLQRTSRFVGRQDVLHLMHSRINSSSDGQIVLSLCGMGGIG
jgi:hypothetical protein